MDEQVIVQMFELIYSNMYTLLPTGNTREHDYAFWRQSFDEGLRNGMRHILCYRSGQLDGYISYVVAESGNTIHLCEFQTSPGTRRRGTTFRALFSEFLREIGPCRAEFVRTYAHDRNPVSQGLIEKMGFSVEERIHKGKRYVISKTALLTRLGSLLHCRPASIPDGGLVIFPRPVDTSSGP